MSNIPKGLKEQSRNLQQLINIGENLEVELDKLNSEKGQPQNTQLAKYHEWFQRVLTSFVPLLHVTQQETILQEIKSLPPTSESVAIIRGKMRGTYLDIEQGKLNHIVHRIQKDDIEDLILLAEEYLKDTSNEIKGHYLAAMCVSIILENAVRKLCERQGFIADNGKWISLGQLIANLKENEALNERLVDQLDVWRKIRNDVAHGNFDVTRGEVEGMINGVKSFVQEHL